MKIKSIESKINRIARAAARPVTIAFLAAFAFAAPVSAGEPIWKKIDRAQLVKLIEGGRVGFVDRGQYPGKEMAVSGIIINAKPEQVWDVLVDFDRYPKMINQITKVEVLENNSKFARLHFYMFLIKLGPVKIQTNYIQKWTFDKPRKITMTSGEEGDKKKKNEIPITWELVPTPDGKRTMLFHTTISNLRDGGMVGAYMVDRQPTIQIGFDLANALTQTEAIKDQIEKKK
jgi:uncharacterized protein YndB with AHSA1/START domain